MPTASADDRVTGRGSAGPALRDVEVEHPVVLKQLRAFKTGALHARSCGNGPRLKGGTRRRLDVKSIGCQLRHLPSIHVEEAATVLRDVRRIDGTDAKVDRFAPRTFRMIGMHNEEAIVGREVDVKTLDRTHIGKEPTRFRSTGAALLQPGAS